MTQIKARFHGPPAGRQDRRTVIQSNLYAARCDRLHDSESGRIMLFKSSMSKVKSSRKEQFLMVRKIGDRKSEQKDDSMFRPGGGAAGANRLNLSTSGAEESRDAESKT